VAHVTESDEWPLEDRGKRVARKIAGNWCPLPLGFS
jgi:hypothetical protein